MIFDRSIVIGCGIGGMAAAAALRGVSTEVVVIEKDRLPDGPAVRRGVPQGTQLHNLLGRAQLELERLLPGVCEALRAAGTQTADVATQTHVYELGARMPERQLGLHLMTAPQPLIENVIRQVMLRADNITVLDESRASRLLVSPAGAVKGVVVEDSSRRQRQLPAVIVVDAAGTSSRAPHWLQALGYAQPPVEHHHVRQWYVSTTFRRPDEWIGVPDCWLVFPTPPNTRSGVMSPSGSEHWSMSVAGRAQDSRPSTADQAIHYAASLEDPWIGDLLQTVEAAGTPVLFRRPTARWRRYDLAADPIAGFLPLGDSVASLNPLFGQGISVASWQATMLLDLLQSSVPRMSNPAALVGLTRTYLQRSADAARRGLHVGAAVEDAVPSRQRKAFARLLAEDSAVHELYVRVWHLLEPAEALTSPSVAGQVIRLKGRAWRQ